MSNILSRSKNFTKQEITDLAAEHCSLLKTNLMIIGNNIGTRSEKMWDLVGVDEDKELVLIKIVSEYSDKIIYNIIEHTEWAWENLNNISRIYPSWGIDENKFPLVFLVSPCYPESFIKLVSLLADIDLNLFTFSHVHSQSGNGILLEPVELPESIVPLTIEDFKNNEMRTTSNLAELTDEEIGEFLGNY